METYIVTTTSDGFYTIRRTFLLPLGLLLFLCLALGVICLIQKEPMVKVFILGTITVPIAVLFFESAFRKIRFDTDAVTVYKLLREKTLSYGEITAVDTVMAKKRVFLSLSTEEDFLIISNAYANFPGLVADLLAKVPEGVISGETREMAKNPPVKDSDIVSCWLAVCLMAFILFIQLGGHL